MADFPELTAADLAHQAGREVSEYSGFATTAIAQSILLFKIATCLKAWPDDALGAELARTAVLAMAEAIYSVQPFQKVLNNPFSSETIGSYSYSKVAGAAANGLPTGVSWFDLAVQNLGVCELSDNVPHTGGIEVFEWDVHYTSGRRPENVRMLTDNDVAVLRQWGYDPSPLT